MLFYLQIDCAPSDSRLYFIWRTFLAPENIVSGQRVVNIPAHILGYGLGLVIPIFLSAFNKIK